MNDIEMDCIVHLPTIMFDSFGGSFVSFPTADRAASSATKNIWSHDSNTLYQPLYQSLSTQLGVRYNFDEKRLVS